MPEHIEVTAPCFDQDARVAYEHTDPEFRAILDNFIQAHTGNDLHTWLFIGVPFKIKQYKAQAIDNISQGLLAELKQTNVSQKEFNFRYLYIETIAAACIHAMASGKWMFGSKTSMEVMKDSFKKHILANILDTQPWLKKIFEHYYNTLLPVANQGLMGDVIAPALVEGAVEALSPKKK